MKQFYELYKDDEKVLPLVTQLSWTNYLKIMSGSKSKEERQMDSGYYERYMLSNGGNLPAIKRVKHQTHNLFMDSYVLEFLDALMI